MRAWWERGRVQPRRETEEVPQKIANGTALKHRDSTSGCLSGDSKNPALKGRVHPRHCSIYSSRDMEATWVSIDRQMVKMKRFLIVLLSGFKRCPHVLWYYTFQEMARNSLLLCVGYT